MLKFKDAVVWVKNIFKINNVYDCARPLLLAMGMFGIGATWIDRTDGVYTLQNTSYSRFITVFMSVFFLPYWIMHCIAAIFIYMPELQLYQTIYRIISYLAVILMLFSINLGYVMSYVSCKRLDRVFHIIHNVDSQLEDVNIKVKHWHITLKLAVIALITEKFIGIVQQILTVMESGQYFTFALGRFFNISYHLFYLWVILFLMILHERFVCLNKVLQENATVTNVHLRDNYVLRRISLARHLHEQLTEAVQLFSDSCRYLVIGFLAKQIVEILQHFYLVLVERNSWDTSSVLIESIKIVVLTSICQANKNQRRVLSARLRHLMAYETNREIILQMRQYIMYNAYTVKGIFDLQFTDIDNVLLLTIIDLVISNVLIIYSYTRDQQGVAHINF